jgi:outer membrane protein TolC
MDKVLLSRRLGLRLAGVLVIPVFLLWTPLGFGADQPSSPSPAPAPAKSKPLDLATCRSLALEHQPSLTAYRASLEATVLKGQALDNLGIAGLIAHDIPLRKQQSQLGLEIAQARVRQAEQEAIYAVTRNYLVLLYARQQQDLLDKAVENLKDLRETVKQIVDDGLRKDVTTRDLERLNVLLLLAEGHREEATNGQERAQAALREAMGFGGDFSFEIVGRVLPSPKNQFAKQQIVDLALSRRAELVQVTDAAAVFALEVKAQATTRHLKVNTFVAGADLHADPVPQGLHNTEYRPGAVGPEMSAILVGSKSERVEQASAYYTRAQAVVEKTRNLINLEAENAFLLWREASRKTARLAEAADKADKLSRDLKEDFKQPGAKVKLDELVLTGILAAQLQGQANDAIRELALTLANLERITAGGVAVDFSPPTKP